MRKLLGKDTNRNTTPSEQKPQPLKTGAGVNVDPEQDQAGDRPPETLAERLQRQSSPGATAANAQGAEPDRSHANPPQSSVVGQSMVIEGELEAAENLTIAGRLEGSVKHTADRLIVGATGVVKANIDAQNLLVEGRIEGDIEARESVTLSSTADVQGNIQTARLIIDDGARFNGKVNMVGV